MDQKNVWLKYSDEEKSKAFAFAKGYQDFISNHKIEREIVKGSVELAKAKGFKDLKEYIASNTPLKAGDKVYSVNKNKAINLFIIGEDDIESGMNIVGAHIDSPRLDVKQRPLYEDHGMVYLKTHYYGGIKKYQWVAIPLSIHGVVAKKDGSVVEISIGDDENDPVFGISDLLIHLAKDQMKKNAAEVVEGEALNVLIGSIPAAGDKKDENLTKKAILDLLKQKYDIEEDDFISAELEVVPAGKARDYGLDRGLILGYGHDDKICAYTSLMAVLDSENPQRTLCCCLVDKEEIGSVGATGMESVSFENDVAEVVNLCGHSSYLALKHTLANSKMISSDVSAGFDANYPEVNDMKNASFLGSGLAFMKYTGSRGKSGANDANAEYVAKVRQVMDEANISYQTCEIGAVDVGGGGTISYLCAHYNMEVIDAGIPVQNMHAPYEVASKADTYEAYKAYKAFLNNMK